MKNVTIGGRYYQVPACNCNKLAGQHSANCDYEYAINFIKNTADNEVE